MKKVLHITLLFLLACGASHAQTITDGLMMPKQSFCTGVLYGHDSWKDYWQGKDKIHNDNMGTVTTQSATWMGTYGLNSKINFVAMLPYIWTNATGGTWHNMHGLQDITVAVKYNFFQTKIDSSTFKAFIGMALAAPTSKYNPDYLPLSIGSGTKRASWRMTLNYAMKNGFYVNASAAYTLRSNVTLKRPTHYSDGQVVYSSEAFMPNVFDLFATIGYHKQALQVEAYYTRQAMLSGDDIRNWLAPEVGNKMNFSKIGGLVMYYLPKPKNLAVRATAGYTVAGRNVGQSTTVMGGLMYTIFFTKKK